MPRGPYLDYVALQAEMPRGNDGLWSVILKLDAAGPWSASDIEGETNLAKGVGRNMVRRLAAGGYAVQVDERTTRGKNPQIAPLYRLAARPAEAPRLKPDGTPLPEPVIEVLWRAMKMTGHFTASELAELASTEERPINLNTARSYCDRLTRAGVMARATRRGEEPRFRLIRNLGARAPKVLATRVVYDPNAGKVVDAEPLREVAP
jgi:hypothetical protein